MSHDSSALPGPLSRIEFLVLEFDHRTAQLRVLDDVGYSAGTRADAVSRAQQASGQAREQDQHLSHVVVRIGVEVTIPTDR